MWLDILNLCDKNNINQATTISFIYQIFFYNMVVLLVISYLNK